MIFFFKNALTPFGLLTPEMRVCSSQQLPVYMGGEQQNRPSKCLSSSWVSSCAFHPPLKERPESIVAVLESSRCALKKEREDVSEGGWSGWSTARCVNIQMSVVRICCNQGRCREWGCEAAQTTGRNERHRLLCSELPYCLSWQHPQIPDAAGS